MNDNTCGHECCSPDLEDGCTVDKCVDHPHAKPVTVSLVREALAHAATFKHFNPTALVNLTAALDAWERGQALIEDIASTPGMLSRTEAYERIQRWTDTARKVAHIHTAACIGNMDWPDCIRTESPTSDEIANWSADAKR